MGSVAEWKWQKRANELKNRSIEIIKSEQQREKRLKEYKWSPRNLCENTDMSNMYAIGMPEKEEKEIEAKKKKKYLKK